MNAPAAKLGFHLSACGHENHYRTLVCKTCGATNVKAVTVDPAGPVVPLPGAQIVVEPYIVLQDFRCQLGDVMGVFKARMVLTDYAQIQQLLAAGNPIVPVSRSAGMTCCPKCQHVFPLMGNAPGTKRVG